MTPDVSVIIPVYNNADTLADQLDGLARALVGAPSTEIVVVDNASTDGSADVALAWSERCGVPIRVVPACERKGEPYARNVGISTTSGRHVLFCDGDDVVRPEWIRALHEALDSEVYATGPVSTDVLNDDWLANVRGRAIFDGRPLLHDVVPFAHGCNMGFRRSVLDDIGGFDESFLAGCDQEIAVRIWRAGHDLAFAPSAAIDYRLRGDLRSTWRQGRSYGRYRIRVRRLIADQLDARALRRANIRRVGWLAKHLPRAIADRGVRARSVWVAAQLVGEAHGTWEKLRGV